MTLPVSGKVIPVQVSQYAEPASLEREGPKSGWTNFPKDLGDKVVDFAGDYLAYLSMTLTCRTWNCFAVHCIGLDLSVYPTLQDDRLITMINILNTKKTEKVSHYKLKINSVNLSKCGLITAKGLSSLATFPTITSLNLNGCRINDLSIESIKTLSLTHLDLGNFYSGACYLNIPHEGLNVVATLNVKHLAFGSSKKEDAVDKQTNRRRSSLCVVANPIIREDDH